jgi:hypothetical protein
MKKALSVPVVYTLVSKNIVLLSLNSEMAYLNRMRPAGGMIFEFAYSTVRVGRSCRKSN